MPPSSAIRIPRAPGAEALAALEWPTLLLTVGVYGAWLALTASYGHLPLALLAPLLVVVIVLHGSLQHEIIHGHPTRRLAFNRLLGMPPLSLWLPYEFYRSEHLQHHHDPRLTDPVDDPESNYVTLEQLQRLPPWHRAVLHAQRTLAGRVLVGSFCRPILFVAGQAGRVIRNEPGARALWLEHALWCLPVLAWLTLVCHLPLWLYLVAMVFPANGVLLIRSFAEHRALREPRRRVAIVEGSRILGPLFLFNNLHSLHHEAPMIPWYRYNRRYRVERERLIAENGGLVYRSYFDVARRFLFTAHDTLLHPTGRVPPDTALADTPAASARASAAPGDPAALQAG